MITFGSDSFLLPHFLRRRTAVKAIMLNRKVCWWERPEGQSRILYITQFLKNRAYSTVPCRLVDSKGDRDRDRFCETHKFLWCMETILKLLAGPSVSCRLRILRFGSTASWIISRWERSLLDSSTVSLDDWRKVSLPGKHFCHRRREEFGGVAGKPTLNTRTCFGKREACKCRIWFIHVFDVQCAIWFISLDDATERIRLLQIFAYLLSEACVFRHSIVRPLTKHALEMNRNGPVTFSTTSLAITSYRAWRRCVSILKSDRQTARLKRPVPWQ